MQTILDFVFNRDFLFAFIGSVIGSVITQKIIDNNKKKSNG